MVYFTNSSSVPSLGGPKVDNQVGVAIKSIGCYTHNAANKTVSSHDIHNHMATFHEGKEPDLIHIATQEAKGTKAAAIKYARNNGYKVVPNSYKSQIVITKIADFFKSIFLGFSRTAQITLVKDNFAEPKVESHFSHRDLSSPKCINKGGLGTVQQINGNKFAFISLHLDSNNPDKRRNELHNLITQAKNKGVDYIVVSGDFNTRNRLNNGAIEKPLLDQDVFKNQFGFQDVSLPTNIKSSTDTANKFCTYRPDDADTLDKKQARAKNDEQGGGFLDGTIVFSIKDNGFVDSNILTDTFVGDYGRSDHAQVSTMLRLNVNNLFDTDDLEKHRLAGGTSTDVTVGKDAILV